MATLQGMSGIDIMAVVDELNGNLPLWIGKIFQFSEREIGIKLNGEHRRKYQFFIEAGGHAHLVKKFPISRKNPTGFAMLLRKFLEGGKVLSVGQYGIQRILYFEVGKKLDDYKLIIELFDDGNVILAQRDGTIIMPLSHHRFKDRDIVRGVMYTLDRKDCATMSMPEFLKLMGSTSREVVKVLAVDCLLGGHYAEEVCRRAGVNKTEPSQHADANHIRAALDVLCNEVLHNRQPVITSSGCWPIVLLNETPEQNFETFNEALAAFYPIPEMRLASEKVEQGERYFIRKQQESAVIKFGQRIDVTQKKIDAMYANYQLVNDVLQIIREASQQYSWQDIEKRLMASDIPIAKRIRAIYPAESAINFDVGEEVKLFINETINANVARHYEQIKKLKKKRDGALKALQQPLKTRIKEKKESAMPKRQWYHRYRWFFTSDNMLVIGGRDASQNEELMKKYIEGGDTFFHADIHGASIVIVKGRTDYPEEVAQFAASYSGAWKSRLFAVDVYSVNPDQVSKTPPSGEYVARGGFIVRGERTYFRNMPLAITIGLQEEPDLMVIGGPPNPIHNKARITVSLRPGTYESNDITKKIVRILRERSGSVGKQGLQQILTTEAIAAFVPSGGSDIVEGDHES